MVMLVVVLAVVLLLVAKQWKAVAPTAVQIDANGPSVTPRDGGQTEAAGELRQGSLPDLNAMRDATGDHAQRVQDALAEIE